MDHWNKVFVDNREIKMHWKPLRSNSACLLEFTNYYCKSPECRSPQEALCTMTGSSFLMRPLPVRSDCKILPWHNNGQINFYAASTSLRSCRNCSPCSKGSLCSFPSWVAYSHKDLTFETSQSRKLWQCMRSLWEQMAW